MKKLLALVILACATMVSAQTVTIVVVTPQRPVDCRTADYSTVNWVYQLQTVREDSDEAQVQFLAQYGQCVGGKTVPSAVDVNYVRAFAMREETVWPWQKEGVKTTVRSFSNTEILVSMTFDKRTLFKKRDENHLSFFYEPGALGPVQYYQTQFGLQSYRGRIQFPWNIDVYLDGDIDGNNSMRMMIR